ncbi:MAG: hypothetical protein ABJC26_08285 [Gemmatimonadaceae bacterium]
MTSPVLESAFGEIDARPRQLLEQYVALAGGQLTVRQNNLVEVLVPPSEKQHFGKTNFVVAYTPDALDEDGQAEILVNGSELLRKVVTAIQSRGALNSFGSVVATLHATNEASNLPVPLESATVETVAVAESVRTVGKLLAKITINAGPTLIERLVETALVDLITGVEVNEDTSEFAVEKNPDKQAPISEQKIDTDKMLRLLIDDLEKSAASDVAAVRTDAQTALASELSRLTSYYDRMIAEAEESTSDEEIKDRKSAIRADRDRRRKEEEFRFIVRIAVYPIQLTQWKIPAEQATWKLRSIAGHSAGITSSRLLVGKGIWQLACPTCGASPKSIRICNHAHTSCNECSEICTICSEACCGEHGLRTCELGTHFVCDKHALDCRSCDRAYCEQHAARCDLNDHSVCKECLVKCARCSSAMCKSHGTVSAPTAPLGERWLCRACVVHCEGGQNEPVGLDEVVRCTTCERHICTTHQAHCAIDGEAHCSKHLRRSDHSGRLLCEAHRSTCADEPHSILGVDEVAACATCGRGICDQHGAVCGADGLRHCKSHLKTPRNNLNILLCEQHRAQCQIDAVVFGLEEVKACPICTKATCKDHMSACKHCGRSVCSRDLNVGLCKTCSKLVTTSDPTDALLSAGLAANGGEPMKSGSWRTSQDAEHTVAEVNFGWSRKLVFTVKHGESVPFTVVRHSMLGSNRTL